MAKNTWKYASLTQRERLKLIRNGDVDVYNAEISNNNSLRNARISAGLDTNEVDLWDTTVKQARQAYDTEQGESKYKVERNKNTPVYGGPEAMASEESRKIKADSLAGKAIDNAEKAVLSLKEHYANAGLKVGSAKYNDKLASIHKMLFQELHEIEKDYDTKLDSKIKHKRDALFA